MSAAKYIRSQGLTTLAYVAKAVGKHPDTLNNWYHKEFALFEIVVAGVSSSHYQAQLEASFTEYESHFDKIQRVMNKVEYGDCIGDFIPDELQQKYLEDFIKAFAGSLMEKQAMWKYLTPLLMGVHKRGEVKEGKS